MPYKNVEYFCENRKNPKRVYDISIYVQSTRIFLFFFYYSTNRDRNRDMLLRLTRLFVLTKTRFTVTLIRFFAYAGSTRFYYVSS